MSSLGLAFIFQHISKCILHKKASLEKMDWWVLQFTVFMLYFCKIFHVLPLGGANGEQLAKFCGNTIPSIPLVVFTPELWAHFQTDGANGDLGFKAKYYFSGMTDTKPFIKFMRNIVYLNMRAIFVWSRSYMVTITSLSKPFSLYRVRRLADRWGRGVIQPWIPQHLPQSQSLCLATWSSSGPHY